MTMRSDSRTIPPVGTRSDPAGSAPARSFPPPEPSIDAPARLERLEHYAKTILYLSVINMLANSAMILAGLLIAAS